MHLTTHSAVFALLLGLSSSLCGPKPPDGIVDRPDDPGAGEFAVTFGVTGSVSDEDGPLTGAQVCAWPRALGAWAVRADEAPRCAMTNARGEYELALEHGAYELVGAAPKHESMSVDLEFDGEAPLIRADLRLAHGGQLFAGRILHPRGEPVANARVSARVDGGCAEQTGAVTWTTDDGEFALWTDPNADLDVVAPNFARDFVIHHPGQRDYVLLPESAIWGRIVGTDGEPVSGARVATLGSVPLESGGFGEAKNAIIADAQGEFRLGELLAGEHRLVAVNADAFGVSDVLDVEYARGNLTVEIVIDQPLHVLDLRVLGEQRVPMAGCDVALAPSDSSAIVRARVDDAGRLMFPVASERVEVVDLACGELVGERPTSMLSTVDGPQELRVRAGHVLRARVVDEGGVVAGQCVRLLQHRESGAVALRSQDRSDDSGEIEFRGLPPGDYLLTTEGMAGPSVSLTLPDAGSGVVALTLGASGRVVVDVPTSDTSRVVHARACEGDWRAVAPVASDSQAVFDRVPPGEVRVALDYSASCIQDHGARVWVAAGETSQLSLPASKGGAVDTVVIRVQTVYDNWAEGTVVYVVEQDWMGLADFDWARADPARFQVTGAGGQAVLDVLGLEVYQNVFAFRAGERGSGKLGIPRNGRSSAFIRLRVTD